MGAADSPAGRAADAYARAFQELREPTVAWLTARLDHPALIDRGAPLWRTTSPLFLDEDVYRDAGLVAATTARCLTALATRLASDAAAARVVGFPPVGERERRLLTTAAPPILGRADVLLPGAGGLGLIEHNPIAQDYPGGILKSALLAQAFATSPAMALVRQAHAVRADDAREGLMDAIMFAHERRGGTGMPLIVSLTGAPPPTGATTSPAPSVSDPVLTEPFPAEILGLIAVLAEHGFGVAVASSAELELSGGRLRLSGRAVDFIHFRDEHLFSCPDDDPALLALLSGVVASLDGHPLGTLTGSKALLSALSEPALRDTFSDEDAAVLDRAIPFTRRVRRGVVRHEGEDVELEALLRAHRELFVLKPTAGARPLVLGPEVSESEWGRAVDDALESPYVAQRVVSAGRRPFCRAVGDPEELYFDLGPYVWNGEASSAAHVRVNATPVMKLGAGATLVPLFVVPSDG